MSRNRINDIEIEYSDEVNDSLAPETRKVFGLASAEFDDVLENRIRIPKFSRENLRKQLSCYSAHAETKQGSLLFRFRYGFQEYFYLSSSMLELKRKKVRRTNRTKLSFDQFHLLKESFYNG
jgi:hypothetical protein